MIILNFLKQFFCEHDYQLKRESYLNGCRIIWFRCKKCRRPKEFLLNNTVEVLGTEGKE